MNKRQLKKQKNKPLKTKYGIVGDIYTGFAVVEVNSPNPSAPLRVQEVQQVMYNMVGKHNTRPEAKQALFNEYGVM